MELDQIENLDEFIKKTKYDFKIKQKKLVN
jgi:hypothetical protein